MKAKALVALLGATAILAIPVLTPDLAGGGSYAYAANARGGDANGGRGGRGAPGAAPAPPSAPVIGYPRGYTVQVSADGTTWSKPVATGKGEGLRTTITFAPTRARFVRITQTDAAADAPAWSIRNLRIYEAPAAKAASR